MSLSPVGRFTGDPDPIDYETGRGHFRSMLRSSSSSSSWLLRCIIALYFLLGKSVACKEKETRKHDARRGERISLRVK